MTGHTTTGAAPTPRYGVDYIAVNTDRVLICTGHAVIPSTVNPVESAEAFDAMVDAIHAVIPAHLGRPGIQRVTPLTDTQSGERAQTVSQ